MKGTMTSGVSLLALLAAQHVFAAAAPVVEAVPIAQGLYLLEGGGGANASVLIGEDGALVVDSKLDEASAAAALSAIDGMFDGEIRFLVNTHVHPDHTGGNLPYGERGAVIIGHEEVREILAAGQRGGPPAPGAALPVLTFGDQGGMTLHLNGETVHIRHMPPAHTTDNSIVHFVNANVYQLGDLYSPVRYPVLAGGTLQGFMQGIDAVLAEADAGARFIPGNGPVMDRAALEDFRAMLADVHGRVSQMVEDGMSLEEVQAAMPTAQYDAVWGSPDRFLPGLYRELAAGE